jgi:L,D-peptidoglycan transpeptidase YkuD (ErfK/YbiS/YcfS/YnhG family)
LVVTALVTLAVAASVSPAWSKVAVPRGARQLIVVSSPTADPPDYLATLRAYERSGKRSPWRPAFPAWSAETGSGHLLPAGARREGDHATPMGVFGIGLTIYGNDPDPGGLHYPYHHLVCGDWWDEDPYSSDYSHFVHVACGETPAFAGWSEALWTENVAYPYFAVIRFNMDPIVSGAKAPGSGIFLHSWIGGPTEGCVALPKSQLLSILRWLRPAAHPVIEIRVARHA